MPTYHVILVEPESSLNVGLVARAMKNFGLRDLRIVAPMFESFEKAYIAAMMASDVLREAKIFSTLEEAIKGIDVVVGTTAKPSIRVITRRAVSLREFISEIRVDTSYGFVFGRESTGLTNEELEMCDVVLNIPSSEEYPTLNLSNAASIVFYELFVSTRREKNKFYEPIPKNIRKLILESIKNIINMTDLPIYKKRRLSSLCDRIIGRMYPCGLAYDEAIYLLGAVRSVEEKLRRVVTDVDQTGKEL
ncbi:MAG: RNA methyltransferase [Candidatus Methanodesulfokora sp.]|jgi:TrmH family RNA methyltransferase